MTKSMTGFGLGLVLFISGCSSIKPKTLDSYVNVGQKLAALDQEVKQDAVSHAALLAPDELKVAEKKVQEARRALFAAETRDRILRKTGLAEAHVEHVRRLVSERQPGVAEILAGRESALNAGVLKFSPTRASFEKIDEKFRDRFPKTEARRVSLIEAYRAVEVTAVNERALRTAREQMAEARRLDARRVAPKALATAERAFRAAEDAIAFNPRRPERFANYVTVAENLARALVAISAQSRAVGARSDEEIAREMLLQKQRMGQLKSELAGVELNADVREQRLREATLENAMNAALEQTRATLGDDSANVYRAGDRLLIRLKNDRAMTSTLTKVKGVILKTKAQDVLVQGGDPRRAAAVSQSLNEVTSVGRLVGPESAQVEVSLRPELTRQ